MIRIPADVEHIIHSASIVSDTADDETCRRNIYLLAVNLVRKVEESPRPLKRLVHISTALALGFNDVDISEEKPGKPALFLPYTRYKVKAEEFLLDEWKNHRLPVVILRPGDIFGPFDRLTSREMLKASERGHPLIVGGGRHRFGLCYTGNLCQAVELALEKEGVEGRAYTVTNGALPTWKEFITGMQKGIGRKQRLHVPAWAAFALVGIQKGAHKIWPGFVPTVNYYRIRRATSTTTYDISKTVRELGYRPDDQTDAQVREIVAWYLKEKENGFIK
jgi:nucleoside-diphosphate-sugar epimerase